MQTSVGSDGSSCLIFQSTTGRLTGGSAAAKATATSAVTTAANQGLDLLRRSHRAWWQQEYYPSSFLSLGDTRLETFYWVCVASYTTASKACFFWCIAALRIDPYHGMQSC